MALQLPNGSYTTNLMPGAGQPIAQAPSAPSGAYVDGPFLSVQTTPDGPPKQVPNYEWGKRNGYKWNGREWVRIAQSEEERDAERQAAVAARAQLDFDLTVRRREADRPRRTPLPAKPSSLPAKPSSPFGSAPANPEDSIRSLIAANSATPQGGM